MAEHVLKIWPEFYGPVARGEKTFELRRNDRIFEVGDTLILREWIKSQDHYTGRVLRKRVTYMLAHQPAAGCAATFGLHPDYVIMQIADIAE